MKRELKIFDKPENVKRLLRGFYASLVVLVLLDFFIHKHAEFPWEGQFGFFATYGFVSCVALIFIARGLRRLIRRDEDYYDRPEDGS
jgi:hypothetical protein